MSVMEFVARRLRGEFHVDPWGLDAEMHDAAVRFGRLRWRVVVEGAGHVPELGPALLVVQRRFGLSESAVVAVGVGSTTNRRVRSAGMPPIPAAEMAMRRVGGALADPAEIRALLRDGHVVSVGLGWSPLHDEPGPVSADVMDEALHVDAPVLPVAVRGREWGRTWHVDIGAPRRFPDRYGRRTAVDAAASVRAAVRRLAH